MMKSGTGLFLIVVLLVGSWVGLGYLYSEYKDIQAAYGTLDEQCTLQGIDLEDTRSTLQVYQIRIQELESQVEILLVENEDLKGSTHCEASALEVGQLPDRAVTNIPKEKSFVDGIDMTELVFLGTLGLSAAGGYGVKALVDRNRHPRPLIREIATKAALPTTAQTRAQTNHRVTVRMSREEANEFIEWQRSKNLS